jgi:methyltransferase, FkbM family
MDILRDRLAQLLRRNVPDLNWGIEDLEREGFFSQFGQDKFVAERLGYKRKGIFIDVGAADGIDMSNTYYFEQELDWSGVAIEPHPVSFLQLQENRKCNLINGCISDFHGKAVFSAMRGGYSQLSRIIDKPRADNGEFHEEDMLEKYKDKDYILVPCYTINEIADQCGLTRIDFLSIDTEGEELSIIKGIDFRKIYINFITIERNLEHDKVKKLLDRAGFRAVATAGPDEIFQRIGFDPGRQG